MTTHHAVLLYSPYDDNDFGGHSCRTLEQFLITCQDVKFYNLNYKMRMRTFIIIMCTCFFPHIHTLNGITTGFFWKDEVRSHSLCTATKRHYDNLKLKNHKLQSLCGC